MVTSLSEIEAEVSALPLRQPAASLLLDDMVKVEPPELATDGQSELEETAEWQPETPEGPQILDPGLTSQTRCQAIPQSEITHSDPAVREVENNEGHRYEADIRRRKTEAVVTDRHFVPTPGEEQERPPRLTRSRRSDTLCLIHR